MSEMFTAYLPLPEFVELSKKRMSASELDMAEPVDMVMSLESVDDDEHLVLSTFAEINDFDLAAPEINEYDFELDVTILCSSRDSDMQIPLGYKDGYLIPTRAKPDIRLVTPDCVARYIGGFLLRADQVEYSRLEDLRNQESTNLTSQMVSRTRPHVNLNNSNNTCGPKIEIAARRSRNFCDD